MKVLYRQWRQVRSGLHEVLDSVPKMAAERLGRSDVLSSPGDSQVAYGDPEGVGPNRAM